MTGGAGFIGTSFIEQVIDDCEIVVFDTLDRNSLAMQGLDQHPNLTLIQGDTRDFAAIWKATDGVTHALHLAAIAGVGTVVSKPAETLTVNLIGTHNVLSALQRRGGVQRVIDVSTSEVYGPNVFRADENGSTTQGSVYEPRWFYAVSKLASEFLTRAYHVEFEIPTTCIRPFNVYGPAQLGEGAIRNFVLNALASRPLIVHGGGDQIRSWCYISDMVEALRASLTTPEAIGRHFNIGNPRATTSTLELARMVIRLADSRSEILAQDISYPDVEVRVPSISEAERWLGFRPTVDLDEGLRNTLAWYRERGVLAACVS